MITATAVNIYIFLPQIFANICIFPATNICPIFANIWYLGGELAELLIGKHPHLVSLRSHCIVLHCLVNLIDGWVTLLGHIVGSHCIALHYLVRIGHESGIFIFVSISSTSTPVSRLISYYQSNYQEVGNFQISIVPVSLDPRGALVKELSYHRILRMKGNNGLFADIGFYSQDLKIANLICSSCQIICV